MRRLAVWIVAALLAGFALGGSLVWKQSAARYEALVAAQAAEPDAALERLELVDERVRALGEDLRALTGQLATNLGVLDERAEERARERDAALARRFDELRAELARAGERSAGLERELAALAAELAARPLEAAGQSAVAAQEPPAELEPRPAVASEPAPAVEPTPEPPAPKPRASFLAFSLPSDDFRAEERRTWTVVPALSRVGFDAKSTLHDFTGVTSEVTGEIEVALATPSAAPSARVVAKAASLRTGEEGRDEGMLENLAVEEHPEIRFALDAFEPERMDLEAGTLAGQARGRLSIRGVERAVAMPVTLELDDAHRLSLEGELDVALPDHGVPVPNKLGLIKMDETVRVWIALRARLEPRSEG